MNVIYLGFPTYGGLTNAQSLLTATMGASERDDVEVRFNTYGSSLLAEVFNQLWRDALNLAMDGEITHFVMCHNDVVPEKNCVDRLLGVMERSGDDLVSTVIPIKDARGLASCGLGNPNDEWDARRYSMSELFQLPSTFNQEDTVKCGLNAGNWPVLFNTGFWIADMRNPKWREVDENGIAKFYFTIKDQMYLKENGKFSFKVCSEDWFFSRQCAKHGIKYSVTREVVVDHYGNSSFPNNRPWGKEKTDELFWRTRQ